MVLKMQNTLSIVKPDAVSKGHADEICSRIKKSGLKIVSKKRMQLSSQEAEGFYIEHKGKPFFNALIEFMISGPIQVQILQGNNAVSRYRELMGNTDPQEARPGTLRYDFAESIDANAVHGSDSEKSAEREISYFFPQE